MDSKSTFLKHYSDHIAEILGKPSGQHTVNPERLKEWIEAQQSETRRALARALSEQTVYVPFDEVKDMCRTLVQQVYAAIPTDAPGKVIWWVGNKTKSGYFISLLCYHYLLELGLPNPADIVIDVVSFESDRIYLKWDDMTYSGSQIEKLNHTILQEYLKEGRTNYPDVRHCLIAATTNAVRRLQKPMFLGKDYPIASRKYPAFAAFLAGRQRVYVDIPFQTYIVREFPTLDETLGAEMHYVCDWFFNREGANCAIYFDHKIADNVSTYMKVLLYGIVPPRTLNYKNWDNPFLIDDLVSKYKKFQASTLIREDRLREVGPDSELLQFKPFINGCPPMSDQFSKWSPLPFSDFMQQYTEYARDMNDATDIPDWDDPMRRCPVSWYKGYFKGGAYRIRGRRKTRTKRRMRRQKLTRKGVG